MPVKIGFLLPRSTEHPSLSFDLLDAFRLGFEQMGLDARIFTENTGFGEDTGQTHALAEKLVLQEDVDLLVAYATSLNAEALYPFAAATGKPILFLDAGMELFEAPTHPLCYHLTLQGLMACRKLALQVGEGQRAFSAASFLDGGYRGSWVFEQAVEESGGSVVGHYVSQYMPDSFTIAPMEEMVKSAGADVVLAAFSSYLDALFMNGLRQAGPALKGLPVLCSPFMADEQLLGAIPFPDAELRTVVPWSLTLDTAENKAFTAAIRRKKNKAATLFHVLGWEAAQAAAVLAEQGPAGLDDWSFEGPRGLLRFHPGTHTAYAPLYAGAITAGPDGNCLLAIHEMLTTSPDEHLRLHHSKPGSQYSRWRNNFFCI